MVQETQLMQMGSPRIIFIDPLGPGKLFIKHSHFRRDWSGGYMPGCLPLPPLDLMYAAAYLRNYGCDVEIVEASVKHWPPQKVVSYLKGAHPDFIFMVTAYNTIEYDKFIASLIKKQLPKTKVIFSGPLVTHDPSIVLSDDNIDFVALGEPELPLLNIMKGNKVENVAVKKNGNIIYGERSVLDLAELPIPARDLINNSAYSCGSFNRKNPITVATISRGCYHSKCIFCPSNLFTLGKLRYRCFDSIIEELDEIAFEYNIGEIIFRDQTFTANTELVTKICEYIITHKLELAWRASTRVDLVDKKLLQLMKRAGCYQISYGFESNSQYSLDTCNKGTTIEQALQASRWTHDAGIEVVGLFLLGIPGDTIKTLKGLVKFVRELNIDCLQIHQPYFAPGTPMYETYGKNPSSLLPHNLVMRHLFYTHIRFYLRPSYLWKQIKCIRKMSDFRLLLEKVAGLLDQGWRM